MVAWWTNRAQLIFNINYIFFKTVLLYCRLVLNVYHSWRWLWTDLPAWPPSSFWDERDVPPHQVNAVLGMEPRDSHALGKPSAHSQHSWLMFLCYQNLCLWSEVCTEMRFGGLQRSPVNAVNISSARARPAFTAGSCRVYEVTITSSTILPSEVSSHKDSCFSQ